MKARETALRLKRFEADEKVRKVTDLETMIREFEAMATDLERQINAEVERTGVKDPGHFAYSTFAKSAGVRRDNLRASTDELRGRLEAAVRDRDEALAQLEKVSTTIDVRETDRTSRRRAEPARNMALR